MRGHGEHIYAHVLYMNRNLPRRLNRIGVENSAGGMGCFSRFMIGWITPVSLLPNMTLTKPVSLPTERLRKSISSRHSLSTPAKMTLNPLFSSIFPVFSTALCSMAVEPGHFLFRRAHKAAGYGDVIGLSAAASENDLIRLGSQKSSYPGTADLERPPGRLPKRMRAGCIPVLPGQEGHHGIEYFRSYRGGRVMIEIVDIFSYFSK